MPTTTFTEVVNVTGGLQISGAAVPSLSAANTFTVAQTIAGGSTDTDRLNLGADVSLYRGAANVLQTDDDFRVNRASGNANLYLKTATREYIFFADEATNDFGIWDNVGGLSPARWTGTIADTETAMIVRRNVGGSLTTQRVSMGAIDSGGAGYKLLRVPN
jgi:hypothetical protein